MRNTLPMATVTIAQLRSAIACEKRALREVLESVCEQKDRLNDRNLWSGIYRKERLLYVASMTGGNTLLAARRELIGAKNRLDKIVSDIDRHNASLKRLSLWTLLFSRRRVLESAELLNLRQHQARSDYDSAKAKARKLLMTVAKTFDSTVDFNAIAGTGNRDVNAMNADKHLRIKRRLLMDNIELCSEIDTLLMMLDKDIQIEVGYSEVQKLIRDADFRDSLANLLKS